MHLPGGKSRPLASRHVTVANFIAHISNGQLLAYVAKTLGSCARARSCLRVSAHAFAPTRHASVGSRKGISGSGRGERRQSRGSLSRSNSSSSPETRRHRRRGPLHLLQPASRRRRRPPRPAGESSRAHRCRNASRHLPSHVL